MFKKSLIINGTQIVLLYGKKLAKLSKLKKNKYN